LGFRLAGIPTYLLLAELALNRVLSGTLPRPDYPAALRRWAPPVWWERSELLFDYAGTAHAGRGDLAPCLGLVVAAAPCGAHAVLAARGEWVRDERSSLRRAGLAALDEISASATVDPGRLRQVVEEGRRLCETAVTAAAA
ncbi:MAG TPA: hypothetical protein VMF60_09935, partial [Acidimicrobiales bacterium]|nr:hypothetical protein [Acidimicrobiales bacterium]